MNIGLEVVLKDILRCGRPDILLREAILGRLFQQSICEVIGYLF